MAAYRQTIGKLGEDEAVRLLSEKGYRIECRNYQTPYGELDIVARDGRILVFVEVKSRIDSSYGNGLEAVTRQKRRHLARAALLYLCRHHMRHEMCRFDVMALAFDRRGVLAKVHHIIDAFAMEGGNYYS